MPVSDLASEILDPILRKRAGISIGLVQSWEEIAGPRLASHTRPEKIVWPRRMQEDDPFQPATLIIACEGFAALHVQHETGEIIGRINSFLGFNAIGRIKIVQKPVHSGGGHGKSHGRGRFRPTRKAGSPASWAVSRTRACAVRLKGWAVRSSAPRSKSRRVLAFS